MESISDFTAIEATPMTGMPIANAVPILRLCRWFVTELMSLDLRTFGKNSVWDLYLLMLPLVS